MSQEGARTMKLKYKLLLFCMVIMMTACRAKSEGKAEEKEQKLSALLMIKAMQDSMYPEITGEERLRQRRLYDAVLHLDKDRVQKCLDEGADPDKCLGVEGWESTNPLLMVIRRIKATYWAYDKDKVPEPVPDVGVLEVLVDGGADVQKLPYVWFIVTNRGNKSIDSIKSKPTIVAYGRLEDPEEEAAYYVNDSNRLMGAFLKAGADADKLGHPYPFNAAIESEDFYMSDETANSYFAQGTRAINEAIKKGMVWESQVDLLLQYTSLDEASLEAARESGDQLMIEKIEKLWREQQK
jgi:hypothetical protein